MKIKYIFLTVMVVGILYFGFPTTCKADYNLTLPEYDCSPTLPYTVEEDDSYIGAACVQMALNACYIPEESQYHDQDVIFSRISLHNTELWYTGDPNGVRGALEDPFLSPCGHWSEFSNIDKNYVLGKMLYWMNQRKYLTPVLIGNGIPWEHWVVVYGYTTSDEPTTSTLSVDIEEISFYDPTPEAESDCCVTGTLWLNNDQYWGVPLDRPESGWHDKYVAIIEPPAVNIQVSVSPWILSGPILSVSSIKVSFYNWLKKVKEKRSCCSSFKLLNPSLKIQEPILINAGNYQYYLVPFENRQLAAIFNSYNGQFEEFRYFQKPRSYISDAQIITNRLKEVLLIYKPKRVEISGTQLRYRPEMAAAGRFSPTWQVAANVTDFKGKKHELTVSLNSAGHVIKGLETLPIPPRTTPVEEPIERKRPFFSIHTGTAIPMGDFADLYKAGINILVDLEYPLKKRFALRTLLGYNQFKSKLVGLDDTSIFNINLNLKYSTPGKPLTLFVEAGPGYYIIKNADNKMGVNVGCGFNFMLSEKILLEFAAHHNTIFTSDKNTYFLHLAGGFIIRFK